MRRETSKKQAGFGHGNPTHFTTPTISLGGNFSDKKHVAFDVFVFDECT
jgi:hypothetical protein